MLVNLKVKEIPDLSKKSNANNQVTIYTDGACSGNPGIGGWGAVLIWRDIQKEISGWEQSTTNNRMELNAVINALKKLTRSSKVELYTDSQYVKQGITVWINKWLVNNWNNGKVKNQDLWIQLHQQSMNHQINWHWLRGHSGNSYNEQADQLARMAIKKFVNNSKI